MYHSDRDISSFVYMQACIRDSQKAATGGVLLKKLVLKISQNSQKKNTCATVSFLIVFIRLQALIYKIREACSFIKKEALAQVFSCEFCKIFKNTIFTEHLRATLSALNNLRGDKVLRNIV